MGPELRCDAVESVVREWLENTDVVLACGDWRAGAIMEMVPCGRAVLTRAHYPPPFAGLRDVRLAGQKHHVHLDLAKIDRVVYTVVPSVCYGYRPSFEAHFVGGPQSAPSFIVMVGEPYRGARPNRCALVGYFRRMLDHLGRFPDLVGFRVEAAPVAPAPEVWDEVRAYLSEAGGEGEAVALIARSLERMVRHEVASA